MNLTLKQPYDASGVTELVDVENPQSEGAKAIPKSGAVSHSLEPLDDVEMGKSDNIADGEMASAVDNETYLRHQEQDVPSCAICLSEYGMLNVLLFPAMRARMLINVLRYSWRRYCCIRNFLLASISRELCLQMVGEE
jgi:hypothetical protein